ncbi:hypothetical protein B0H17DRAFT_1132313 [Mycena rosella]|uniref:Uncharacterized protein n=1 Tax=Mycena rosella TaxID=1033263 RepID=A0AAD7DKL8_MYCRO|nr:hypothetical protein B0H17DRAFT_1132313 [Mycena rosella]
MHPALCVSRLKDLPSTIRDTAYAAANGSMQNMVFVNAFATKLPPDRAILLLPVFYVHLSMGNIPASTELDGPQPTWTVRKGTQMAVFALEGLYSIRGIPEDACPDLWPHLWKWVHFLFTFREQLHWIGSLTEQGICNDLLKFVGLFVGGRTAMSLFCSTEGFLFIIGRAWFFLLEIENFEGDFQGYDSLYSLIECHIDLGVPENLAQLAEGAGGGFYRLGFLVVRQMRRVLPSRDVVLSERSISFFHLILAILHKIEDIIAVGQVYALHPLTVALLPHGIVKTLTTIAWTLSRTTITKPTKPFIAPNVPFTNSLSILGQIFVSPNGHQQLPEALECGLLEVLVSAGTSFLEAEYIILKVLVPFTLYHNVLSALDVALLEVAEMERDDKFLRSEVYLSWSRFRPIANRRLMIFKRFHREVDKACDNIEDSANVLVVKAFIIALVNVKFTTGVMAVTAKTALPAIHCLSMSNSSRPDEHTGLRVRERSFLRSMMNYEYCSSPSAQRKEIAFMNNDPNAISFTLFDYTLVEPKLEITVKSVTDAGELGLAPQWHAAVARAAESGGRIRLHVMRITKDAFPPLAIPGRVYQGVSGTRRRIQAVMATRR